MAFNIDSYNNLDFDAKTQVFLKDLEEYLSKETDIIANLANTSAFISAFFENVNWSGFYLLKENQLVLGPFCGMPATTRIAIGKGVCGTAFEKNEILVVDNVCEFPGHIACDVRSKSEVVIPLVKDGKKYGVLDIDSGVYSRFSKEDVEILKKVLEILYKYTDLENLK
ncbi:GAF domain-containing protein [Fusobacterium sp.]|uniref:GAF domain-containing protein n=1 Tax=Fusobacterium sp. TaxID=68766 RepID=UPI002607395F|nr:GAF domain-containing protein [Fusobacterium sp.]